MNKAYIVTGAVFICLGILLGAFGAHSFEVGVRYQMYQGLALLALGLNQQTILKNKWPYGGFTLGIILFSGSIYALSIDRVFSLNLSFLGPITPIGGAILIATWIYFIVRVLKPVN